MKVIHSMSKHLNNHNWWIHLTVITIITFLYSMTIAMPYGQLVYLHSSKWYAFFKFLAAIIVCFSPVLLYSYFRSKATLLSPKLLNNFIWVLVFILYPFSFLIFNDPIKLWSINIMPENLLLIGLLICLTEIFTHPNPIFTMDRDLSQWKQKVSPEWIVIVLFIMLAIYLSIQLKMEYSSDATGFKSGFWIGIQCTVLAGIYYIFYLINHYFLVNKIYKARGVVYYFFGFLALLSLFTIPLTLVYYYFPAFRVILQYKLAEDWVGADAPNAFWAIYIGSIFFLMIITIPLTILIQWISMAKKVNSLEKEKIDNELSLLKQQINPHFFFNTLNNIYAMSRKKNKDTPEAILQLSDLMRYVIYKGKESTVTLKEEIKYIEDYIKLQQLRLSQSFDYKFEIDLQDPELKITPLLYIILIENAFKHGIELASEECFLHLTINQIGKQVTFSARNSIEDNNLVRNPGVGLENLKRRLELIYPNSHRLNIEKSNRYYKVNLSIDL